MNSNNLSKNDSPCKKNLNINNTPAHEKIPIKKQKLIEQNEDEKKFVYFQLLIYSKIKLFFKYFEAKLKYSRSIC